VAAEERGDPDPAYRDRQAAGASGSPRPGTVRRVIDFFDSATKIFLAIGGAIGAAALLWAGLVHFLPSGNSDSSTSGLQSASTSFVVQPESCGALTFGADGNAGPVTCPDGRPNLAAVSYFAKLHLKVLSLGAGASPGAVENAICQDWSTGHTTFPIEASAVQLATAEQDWHFGINPAQNISSIVADCKNITGSSGSQ
jgi:hypothetical protein